MKTVNRVAAAAACVCVSALGFDRYSLAEEAATPATTASATATSATAGSPEVLGKEAIARITAEDFAALPFLSGPRLSPSGGRVLAGVKGDSVVAVIDLEQSSKITHAVQIPDNFDLNWYRWAGDERMLISLGQQTRYFDEDVYATRLLMYDLASKKAAFVGKRSEGIDGDDVVHVDPHGQSLLLSIQETIHEYPSVWNVDLNTLAMKEVVRSRPGVWDWFADSSGVVRAGMGWRGQRWWLIYRKDGKEKFEKVISRKVTEEDEEGDIEKFVPIDGNDSGYAISNKATGRYGLYRYNFATDTLGEPIFEHPQVDIDDFYQATTGEIKAVYYTDDRSRIVWLDPEMKAVQADIDKALPNQITRVVSISRDGKTMLVWTGGATDPGGYYIYKRAERKMWLLTRPYEHMENRKLAAMESVTYKARDGVEIPAYLTTPPGREAKALPLIIMPHGGPFVRDEWAYDPQVQFLANRGYVVLQPNYRGSTGYGKAFVEKGMGQWGRAMQDDLDDGVKWLVDQGKVDPKRVCIMGSSYGGYAAMWAAARNPDVYRCAISFAGISDVQSMLRYDRRLFAATRYYRNWRERVQGDKEFDLATISPLQAIDRIQVPLLIAHGDKDRNVPLMQSRKLHEALARANKPHEYVVYEGEAHGFVYVKNAIDYLNRVEAFLAKYNAADP